MSAPIRLIAQGSLRAAAESSIGGNAGPACSCSSGPCTSRASQLEAVRSEPAHHCHWLTSRSAPSCGRRELENSACEFATLRALGEKPGDNNSPSESAARELAWRAASSSAQPKCIGHGRACVRLASGRGLGLARPPRREKERARRER